MNPILSKHDYPSLSVKIGIDEGENIVFQYGYNKGSQVDILGYTMNVTSKITSITSPNGVLCFLEKTFTNYYIHRFKLSLSK